MRSVPIFEFTCRACRHEFETLVRSAEIPSCTQCASTALDKKLSVFATSQQKETAVGPCGACGHPGGPGSCAIN
jgi:putative FmdB family regulatory protein